METCLNCDVLGLINEYRIEMEDIFSSFRESLKKIHIEYCGYIDNEFEFSLEGGYKLIEMGITPNPLHFISLLDMHQNNEKYSTANGMH